MKIREPLHDNVIIEKLDDTEKQYGNIIIPDSGTEKSMVGKVIAVGPGRQNLNGDIIPCRIKVNDIVAFSSFGGQKLFLSGNEFLVYKETDLLTTLNDE